jgi:hypothetical protein
MKQHVAPEMARQMRYTKLYLGWLLLSYVWFFLIMLHCLPSYRPDINDVIDYWSLINIHSKSIITDLWLALVVTCVVGLILIVRSNRSKLIYLMLPSILPPLLVLGVQGGCIETSLQNIDSVEFENHIFYFTTGTHNNDFMTWTRLYVHCCDINSNNCIGHQITGMIPPRHTENPTLIIDEQDRNLLISVNGEKLLTITRDELDTGVMCLPAPSS